MILNKIDLADRPRLDQVRDFVLERLPTVRLIETVHADVAFDVLIGTGPGTEADSRWLDDHDHDHDHRSHHGFTSWVYRRDGAFDVAALRSAIARLPNSVYRIKGFLHGADEPGHRQLLQAVGMRGDVQPFDEWGDRPRSSELVIIADGERVDRAAVEAMLDACLTAPTIAAL